MISSKFTKSNKHILFSKFSELDTKRYHRNYFDGIEKNLQDIQKIYGSGWSMRLYYQLHSDSDHLRTLCNLACKNTEDFELCDIEHIPKFGKHIFILPVIFK